MSDSFFESLPLPFKILLFAFAVTVAIFFIVLAFCGLLITMMMIMMTTIQTPIQLLLNHLLCQPTRRMGSSNVPDAPANPQQQVARFARPQAQGPDEYQSASEEDDPGLQLLTASSIQHLEMPGRADWKMPSSAEPGIVESNSAVDNLENFPDFGNLPSAFQVSHEDEDKVAAMDSFYTQPIQDSDSNSAVDSLENFPDSGNLPSAFQISEHEEDGQVEVAAMDSFYTQPIQDSDSCQDRVFVLCEQVVTAEFTNTKDVLLVPSQQPTSNISQPACELSSTVYSIPPESELVCHGHQLVTEQSPVETNGAVPSFLMLDSPSKHEMLELPTTAVVPEVLAVPKPVTTSTETLAAAVATTGTEIIPVEPEMVTTLATSVEQKKLSASVEPVVNTSNILNKSVSLKQEEEDETSTNHDQDDSDDDLDSYSTDDDASDEETAEETATIDSGQSLKSFTEEDKANESPTRLFPMPEIAGTLLPDESVYVAPPLQLVRPDEGELVIGITSENSKKEPPCKISDPDLHSPMLKYL